MHTPSLTLRLSLFLSVFLCCSPALLAQASAPAPASSDAVDTRLDDIIKDTQRPVGGKDIAGLVWWIPAEFWEVSAVQQGSTPEKARETFAPMREYTMVIVAVGKVGIGNITWYSEADVRSSTTLRDADGQSYKPLADISPDATGIASIVKPVLGNTLGQTGQNLQIMFFPAKTAAGKFIADPTRAGSFSVVIENLAGPKLSTFEWRLPLTSLSPPRFCPVGKERVEANWKYCPWHGVKLPDSPPAFIPLIELKPKSDKPQ